MKKYETVLDYLKQLGTELNEFSENYITIGIQEENEMALVSVNDTPITGGNYWDFYPGCHGIPFDFRGYDNLARLIHDALTDHGYKSVIHIDQTWRYD